jgi:GTP-binding protein EngB required for normal cell division
MTDEFLVNKNFDEIKNSQNNIVLFGSVGNGKTTLINKLCHCDLITKSDGFSCTRDVQYSRTHDGSLIIDFPGLNAAEDIVKHLQIQKSTLSVIPAKMICLVIKLTARYDDIVKSALQMIRIFASNRDNICVIITFCEELKMPQAEEIKLILQKKCKIKPENIVFTSNNMSSDMLLSKLNSIKSNMKNIEKIQLKDRDLLNTVGTDGDIDVIEERDKFLDEFKDSLAKFKKEFDKATDNSLKFALYYAFFDYKEELIERFTEVVRKKVTDTDTAIVEIITFNNEIFSDFNGFTKQVQAGLKAETANFDNSQHNNRYRKCPHCGTIWFKIKGCNSMPCGRRTKLRDIFLGRFKNYVVKFVHGIFKIGTLSDVSDNNAGQDSEFVGLTEEEKKQNLNRNGLCLIQAQGCGRNLDWTQMEDVTEMVNKQITEIYMDSYDNKVKEKIQTVKVDIFNK